MKSTDIILTSCHVTFSFSLAMTAFDMASATASTFHGFTDNEPRKACEHETASESTSTPGVEGGSSPGCAREARQMTRAAHGNKQRDDEKIRARCQGLLVRLHD